MKNLYRRGDTIIEVIFAITIFTLVAVLSITLMNSGVATAQTALETEMARNEIDAQAEALRFIHNSYTAEMGLAQENRIYEGLWNRIVGNPDAGEIGLALTDPDRLNELANADIGEICRTTANYDDMINYFVSNIFVINTRHLDPNIARLNTTVFAANRDGNEARFNISGLHPRIIYQTVGSAGTDSDEEFGGDLNTAIFRVEGLWVIPVTPNEALLQNAGQPEFYDFYIRTCWAAPGRARPASIGTIVRLYNPAAR